MAGTTVLYTTFGFSVTGSGSSAETGFSSLLDTYTYSNKFSSPEEERGDAGRSDFDCEGGAASPLNESPLLLLSLSFAGFNASLEEGAFAGARGPKLGVYTPANGNNGARGLNLRVRERPIFCFIVTLPILNAKRTNRYSIFDQGLSITRHSTTSHKKNT